MSAYEMNFDGLVGPTHNYGGLSYGNVASQSNSQAVSSPREAAKQGLGKMKALMDMGFKQGVFAPQERQDVAALRSLGFAGSDAEVIARAAKEAMPLLAACSSASSMWTANSCTVSPSADTADGRVHFTAANLNCKFHRSIEHPTTSRVLGAMFADAQHFAHHAALPAVAQFGDEHADRVRFYVWAQWAAHVQYRNACHNGVDVIADLAVGFDAGSADAWIFQDLLEFDFEIGAPPDAHNTEGQRWGLPPFNPSGLQRADFAPFIEMVHLALRYAGSLRMDHVMQLWRLYWVPVDGGAAEGVYVYYPVDALLAILRVEAMRADAWIVGEDMGTVAEGVRDTMESIGMLGNRSGMRTPISEFPVLGVGTSSTHDQVTVAGLLTGSDVQDLKRIGKNADWKQVERTRRSLAEMARIDPDRPVASMTEADVKAAVLSRYRLLSDADSVMVVVNIDDAAMVPERPNMPGTVDAYPNWKFALPQPVDDVMTSELADDLVRLMHEDR